MLSTVSGCAGVHDEEIPQMAHYRFLPRWAYESLLDELAAANKKQEELRQTVERQQCYISGLEYALRHMTPTVVVESHEKETKEKAG